MIFKNRNEAGRLLAERLKLYQDKNAIVLAIPRGGVVVGYEVAKVLKAPLDVIISRKIGAPYNPELAIGAVSSTGEVILDHSLVSQLGVGESYIASEVEQQKAEIERRMRAYRGSRPPLELKGKVVILVDDGVATGSTMLAAIKSVKSSQPQEVVLALPVGPSDAIQRLSEEVDRTVCLSTPEPFFAVGQFYRDWPQTTDQEVVRLLEELSGLSS